MALIKVGTHGIPLHEVTPLANSSKTKVLQIVTNLKGKDKFQHHNNSYEQVIVLPYALQEPDEKLKNEIPHILRREGKDITHTQESRSNQGNIHIPSLVSEQSIGDIVGYISVLGNDEKDRYNREMFLKLFDHFMSRKGYYDQIIKDFVDTMTNCFDFRYH